MTGATTSFLSENKQNYNVSRQWSFNKNLPNLDSKFSHNETALMHFLQNVDVIKVHDEVINRAKKFCSDFFLEQEKISDFKTDSFHNKLQSGLGIEVNIYDHNNKDLIIAKGHLLQLFDDQVQVQISQNHFPADNLIQAFPVKQVALI
ncbi:hypothetical protein [Pseudoalteromonas denitrificans]|uniref:Uncharacterized protein n=1 Tax=Pseudoalteromonas denitrificans DSM 6059 TaxID=1123010 RepID=A0A1I1FXJ3_9GAMM|nr:hypothetical protein [Pseudoalteromonas denitrificans]SFC01763.1 hypothetical protein SAMN02745724_00731 [Pseudoalteromonas denitrificans DSM 6059]